MGKIIAIDYGAKRVGLAVSDDRQQLAFGLTTVHSSELIEFLKDYTEKESIDCFVLGFPKTLRNTETNATPMVENFAKHLRKVFPNIGLDIIDERFTSKLAVRAMIDSGLSKKKRQNKSLIDEISASILLQDYLEQKNKGFR